MVNITATKHKIIYKGSTEQLPTVNIQLLSLTPVLASNLGAAGPPGSGSTPGRVSSDRGQCIFQIPRKKYLYQIPFSVTTVNIE